MSDDLIAYAVVAAWVVLVGLGLWRDLPGWVADAESDDE